MKTILAAGVFLIGASPVWATEIERACMGSSRAGGDRALCGCIQDAANLTLSTKDQKLAAEFFRDPDRAQEIRMSKRRNHEQFWDRYQNFGRAAESFCRR